MLLGKLWTKRYNCANVHAQDTAVLLFETQKINLQNTTHNITSTTQPTLSFYLRETYRICNFLANCCDYTRKQCKAPISLSPEVYETSSKTGSGIRILYLLTGPVILMSIWTGQMCKSDVFNVPRFIPIHLTTVLCIPDVFSWLNANSLTSSTFSSVRVVQRRLSAR